MSVVAMTREMGSPGSAIGREVADRLGYEYLRNDLIARVVRDYRVRETGVVGAVEEGPGLLERLRPPRRRYRTYLEAAVLDAARRERVVLMGRWSTLFLRGVPHAVRIRICEPVGRRVRRVMERFGVSEAEARRRVQASDEGVRTRIQEMFDVDWRNALLYDLVINLEAVRPETAVGQILALVQGPEFQPTAASRTLVENRALAARVRATLKATPATARVDVDCQAAGGRLALAGVVGSDEERELVLGIARAVPGVTAAASEIKVFRRPIR